MFKLQEANSALVLARNLTHSLSSSEVGSSLEEGTKALEEVKTRGEQALREARFRRSGLVVATVFILLLAVALFLKVRQIQTRPGR